jgi:hypothetical protein
MADVGAIEDMSDAVFRAQIETNLFGVVNVTKAAIPVKRGQRAGHVIQISSIGGRTSAPGIAAYQTAKWGVEGFSGVPGSSMTIRDSRPEYDGTVGAIVEYRKSHAGTEQGDAAKAAAAILHIAQVEEPPLRLLLGGDAVYLAEQYDLARTEFDVKWQALSLSTDLEASGEAKSFPWEKK